MCNHKLCMNKINQNEKKNRKEEKSKPKREPAMSYPFPPPPEISLQTSTSPVTLFPNLQKSHSKPVHLQFPFLPTS